MQQERLQRLGLTVPHLLLPKDDVDVSHWAVIACDQHTSDHAYWESVEEIVDGEPSTYRLIFPEAYLDSPDQNERIRSIHTSMEDYLADGTLVEQGEMGALVRRELPDSGTRWGMLLALDLETYDYDPDSKTLVRATESTIVERIPPRVAIRKGASLELPHILMLLDDPERTVIEPLTEQAESFRKLYDGDLMLGGGRLTGYALEDDQTFDHVSERLETLIEHGRLRERYGSSDPLLLAVGDGNHSLAAAKTVWEELKAAGANPATHPARYALVEIVNLYDDGLRVEPIHRVVFGVKRERFIARLQKELGAKRTPIRDGAAAGNEAQLASRVMNEVTDSRESRLVGILGGESTSLLECQSEGADMPGVLLQRLLDEYSREQNGDGLKIDYVHELETVARLCEDSGNLGFILPPLDRGRLFPWVVRHGPLPRKIFSMGLSAEKRYYMEARRIDAWPPSEGSTSAEDIALEEQQKEHDEARG